MIAGASGIMNLMDTAPVFAEPMAIDSKAIDEAVRKFGLAELDKALAIVRAAQGDTRATVLAMAAETIGQLAAAGALHEGFARAALEEAAASCGLIRDIRIRAVKSAISAGLKRGIKTPRDLSDVRRSAAQEQPRPRPAADIEPSLPPSSSLDLCPAPSAAAAAAAPPNRESKSASSQTGASASKASAAGAGRAAKPPRDVESGDALNMRLAFFPLTDLGNAERFRERYKSKLKWCKALGWLAWDGKRWSRENADSVVKIGEHDTVRAIQHEAAAVRESGIKDVDDGGRDFIFEVVKEQPVMFSDKIARWGRASEAVNKLGALSKRGEPYFAIGIEKLDADKFKINVNNGTLVIARKSEGDYVSFQPHDPDDLITKISPVDYDPEATCDEYDKFLARVQPQLAMRAFLHQWGGLSLTGDVSEQKMAFLYGKGSNGKSVLIDAWSFVAGDYGETVPIETFIDQGKSRSGGQATPDLAILPGVRMLRTSEPEKNSKLAEAMIKLLTGGEPIQARHLNKDFFKFYPQFSMTMSGNYRPVIAGTDEGIWRRMRLVPFNITIPKEERDVHLSEKLRAEASGILNRLLDGLRHWCDKGLSEPEDVTKATADYRSSSDPLGRFLATCVEASKDSRVQSSVLHQVYEAWCKSSGETAWRNKGLSMAMEERGFVKKQSDVMWWLDIKLIKSASDFVDREGNPIKISDKDETNMDGNPGDTPF